MSDLISGTTETSLREAAKEVAEARREAGSEIPTLVSDAGSGAENQKRDYSELAPSAVPDPLAGAPTEVEIPVDASDKMSAREAAQKLSELRHYREQARDDVMAEIERATSEPQPKPTGDPLYEAEQAGQHYESAAKTLAEREAMLNNYVTAYGNELSRTMTLNNQLARRVIA
jgi:hypothetical protein